MEKLKFKLSPEVLVQEVSGETVLLDLASESYFGLDSVGTRIWQLLQEKDDLESIIETMFAEYDVGTAQLKADLVKLIGELKDAGLVTAAPVGS